MMTAETPTAEWSFAKRLGFRFLFCYFALFIILNASVVTSFYPIPFTGRIVELWNAGIGHALTWTGAHILHLAKPVIYNPMEGGDGVQDYVGIFLCLTLGALASLAWMFAGRERKDDARAAVWLRVLLRYMLAITMLSYGFDKVFSAQFGRLDGQDYLSPLGHLTPMGLAWTFMSYSAPYTVFAGALECLGAFLLFFRRTTTLGAMLITAVLTNVVMMNFSYDICVKVFSTHLLLMSLAILWPSMDRLMALLVFHRTAEPEDIRPPQLHGWRKWTRWSVKPIALAFFLYANIQGNLPAYKAMHAVGFDGENYAVESFVRNGADIPALVTDASRWRYLLVFPHSARVCTMDGTWHYFKFKADAPQGLWTLTELGGKVGVAPIQFHVEDMKGQGLKLDGQLAGDQTEIRISRLPGFALTSERFHWINPNS